MGLSDDMDTKDFNGIRPGSVANLPDDNVEVNEETKTVSETVSDARNVEFQPARVGGNSFRSCC